MNCSEIKELFESKLELCIYFRGADRNIIPLTNGTVTKYGVGCSGVMLNDKMCGEDIS